MLPRAVLCIAVGRIACLVVPNYVPETLGFHDAHLPAAQPDEQPLAARTIRIWFTLGR